MAESLRVLITGASSGFGLGAAKALAERGHRVFAGMRGTKGKNERVASELRAWSKTSGKALEVVELDVTDEASVSAAVSSVVGAAGGVDVLLNNAGVGTWGLQEAFTADQIKAMFDVNVFGMLRMNRAVLPAMRKAGKGYIVYVSSGLGRIQFPFLGPYTASKHAVEAIAESASYELGPQGIETTILQPGAYGTSFLGNSIHPADAAMIDGQPKAKAMFEGFAKGFEERAKSGQLGNPQEIIDAMVSLVEAAPGTRPLRRTVGQDVAGPVTAINEVCATVQNQLLTHMGLR